jgi:hypothetical protein
VLWTWDAESAGAGLHVEGLGMAAALRLDDDEEEPTVWEHQPDDGDDDKWREWTPFDPRAQAIPCLNVKIPV